MSENSRDYIILGKVPQEEGDAPLYRIAGVFNASNPGTAARAAAKTDGEAVAPEYVAIPDRNWSSFDAGIEVPDPVLRLTAKGEGIGEVPRAAPEPTPEPTADDEAPAELPVAEAELLPEPQAAVA